MNPNHHIQAVIFDVGGVLDRQENHEARRAERVKIAASVGLELDVMWDLFFRTEPWKLARTGQITDDEFWNRVLTPLGITDPAEQRAWVDHLIDFKGIMPETRALLEELHGRVRLAIISNATNTLEESLENQAHISHYFELIVNSARVGYAKPDRAIFEIALERLELRPEQTVFTDDQQHNVDAATELGMHAALWTGVADFRAFLVELGVLD